MINFTDIKQVHIELTTRCQAQCPMCPRNYRGMDYNSGYPVTELTLDNIKTMFSDVLLSQLEQVLINGNLGDFGLAKDGPEIVHWFVENTQAKILINTNGSMHTPSWWAELAHPRVRVIFALDGLEDTHSVYRKNTDFSKIIDNAQAYMAAGGHAVWQMIVFNHNQHQIKDCEALSVALGFKEFWLFDKDRNQGPVYNRDGTFSHWIGQPHEHPEPPDPQGLLRDHVTWFDKLDLSTIQTNNVECYSKKNNEIYIAADGSVYPCCYLGFYPETMTSHPGNRQTKRLIKENNALIYGIEHAIEWFNQVEQTWAHKSCADGLLYTCAKTCGRN